MKEKIVSNNSVVMQPFQNPPLSTSTDIPAVIDKGEGGSNEDDSSLGLFKYNPSPFHRFPLQAPFTQAEWLLDGGADI